MAFSARETTKIKPILQLSSVFELVTLSSSADITLMCFPCHVSGSYYRICILSISLNMF